MIYPFKYIRVVSLLLFLMTAIHSEDLIVPANKETKIILKSNGVLPKKSSKLTIENGAKILIDGSRYTGGSAVYEVFEFDEIIGSLEPDNIKITSFKAFYSAELVYNDNSIDLVIATQPISDPISDLWFTINPRAGSPTADKSDLVMNNGWIRSKLGKTGKVRLNGSEEMSCVRRSENKQLIYSISWEGNDFNSDGERDQLTFDLHVEGYNKVNYSLAENERSGSISSLASVAEVTENDNRWGVGTDGDLDASEGVKISIQNVNISVSDYDVSISGFNEYGLLEKDSSGAGHQHIRADRLGVNGTVYKINAQTTYDFDYLSPLIIGSVGSESKEGFQLSGLNFHLKVYKPGQVVDENPSDYSDTVHGVLYGDAYPAQQKDVEFPQFSWDRIPRWLAVRSSKPYTDDQLDVITDNYQLVLLEKNNRNGTKYTEEGIIKLAADIKSKDEKIKVLSYWNANFLYKWYEAENTFDDKKWSNGVKNNVKAHRKKGFYPVAFKYNHSIPEMRDWWIDAAEKIVNTPNVDGIFIDSIRVSNIKFYDDSGVPHGVLAAMLERLRNLVPEDKMMVGNCLKSYLPNGNRQLLECFDGSYVEGWYRTNRYNEEPRDTTNNQKTANAISDSIQFMREALHKGKLILFQYELDGKGDNSRLQNSVYFPLAVYLMVVEKNAYFGYNMGVNAGDKRERVNIWDTNFIKEFNRPLGKALGPPEKEGFIYTRSFEHLKVTVDLETREVIYEWAKDADADGVDDEIELEKHGSVFTQ